MKNLLVKTPKEIKQEEFMILDSFLERIKKEIETIKSYIKVSNDIEIQNFLYAVLKDYQNFLYRENLLRDSLLRGTK